MKSEFRLVMAMKLVLILAHFRILAGEIPGSQPIQLKWREGKCLDCAQEDRFQVFFQTLTDTHWVLHPLDYSTLYEGLDKPYFQVTWMKVIERQRVFWSAKVNVECNLGGGQWKAYLNRYEWKRSPHFVTNTPADIDFQLKWLQNSKEAYPESNQGILQKSFDTSSVLAAGSWFRLAFGSEGIYKLTPSWLISKGISLSLVQTGQLAIFGGAGGPLPEHNAQDRPSGLKQYPLQFVGDQDGYFEQDEYFLFYVPSSDALVKESGSKRLTRVKNPYHDSTFCFLNPNWSGPVARISARQDSIFYPLHLQDRADFLLTHELELTNPIRSGRQWLGESFDQINSRTLNWVLPSFGPQDSCDVRIKLAARNVGSISPFQIKINNLPTRIIQIPTTTTYYLDDYYHSAEDAFRCVPGSNNINLQIQFQRSSSSSVGWLDKVEFQFRPKILPAQLPSGGLFLHSLADTGLVGSTGYYWPKSSAPLYVWDISTPWETYQIPISQKDTIIDSVISQYVIINSPSPRQWVIWSGNSFPNPVDLSPFGNQNLHGQSGVEMVIVCPENFRKQAEEIRQIHWDQDGLRTAVVSPNEIYAEFSSGRQDPVAIRDFLRMLYYRWRDLRSGNEPLLKYLLLFGSASYDFKGITGSGNTNLVPLWQSINSQHPIRSYSSDAFYGLLDSAEGRFIEGDGDRMDLGIGRIPARNEAHAIGAVRKIRAYLNRENNGSWKNQLVFLADDQDYNLHLEQCMHLSELAEERYPFGVQRKLYMDAFDQESRPGGARYPTVNEQINRNMNQGSLIMAYLGHGGVNGLAEERVMTNQEIESWSSAGKFPLLITATCEFARFDNPSVLSAGERALLNPMGGPIALLTTTRVTFTDMNFSLSSRLFRDHLFRKDNGRYLALGEVFSGAANPDLGSVNTRNFTLLGDPALRLAFPSNRITVDPVTDSLKALSNVVLTGEVLDDEGNKDQNFDGEIEIRVLDKPVLLRTKANDADSQPKDFIEYKDLIFKGRASVVAGFWRCEFKVPKDIMYAYGNGRINLYASKASTANNDFTDATGDTRNLVVGGSSSVTERDHIGPLIQLKINDSLFRSGTFVTTTAILEASLYDSSGINSTGSGIGREILLTRNENWNNAEVLSPYYLSDLDNYRSGKITYPLGVLVPGSYSLSLRAWDTYNNSSISRINFNVLDIKSVAIHGFFSFPNPVQSLHHGLVFELNHNRPGVPLDLDLEVYNSSGQCLYTAKDRIVPVGFVSRIMEWNGVTRDGQPLVPGIYFAQLKVSDGNSTATAVTKILVLGR